METDLHSVIKSPQPLTNEHIQVFHLGTFIHSPCIAVHAPITRWIKLPP